MKQRYAIIEKVRIVEEVRYDTVQVCDSLEQAQSLIEETPWREIVPYLSEEYERKRHYRAYSNPTPVPLTEEQLAKAKAVVSNWLAEQNARFGRFITKTKDTIQ